MKEPRPEALALAIKFACDWRWSDKLGLAQTDLEDSLASLLDKVWDAGATSEAYQWPDYEAPGLFE